MPSKTEAIETAASLMEAFAERTGIGSGRSGQRYLWTDAFAVCNLLALGRSTAEQRYTELALTLVDQVHHVLGRHRSDDARSGWISGLSEADGEAHPTCGGLRIGKPLPERTEGESMDEALEWDRDGQYFHYLTKWMHALDQVSSATRDPRFNLWARELAEVSHASFAYDKRGDRRRMHWKMSTDLSRPLVPSMGQHDPLDGFITCAQLEATARALSRTPAGPSLKPATADFARMLEVSDVRTVDPLGLGGLLSDAFRVVQLMEQGEFAAGNLLEALLAGAHHGLSLYARHAELGQPASLRLAFRELGLAIGISAIDLIAQEVRAAPVLLVEHGEVDHWLAELRSHAGVGTRIASFWRVPESRTSRIWTEHRDINDVMLATSLIPEGFLRILPRG